MDANSIAALFKGLGELGIVGAPALAISVVIYAVVTRPPAVKSDHITRADFDKLEQKIDDRLREIEGQVHRMAGYLEAKK